MRPFRRDPTRRSSLLDRASRKAILPLALLCMATSIMTGGCSEPPSPDVVIVLFDTLRKDHVGSYGYVRDTTPTVDAIAREGLVFENAIAQSSWTRPSVASLFTSRYDSDFHPDTYMTDDGEGHLANRMPDSALTLAEIFAANGYRTVSVTTNMNLHYSFNLDQGFEENHFEKSAPADWVIDRAIESFAPEVDDDRRPLFLYLHFMEPHLPLDPPEPYASMYPTLDGLPHKRGQKEFFAFSDYATEEQLQSRVFENFKSHVLALYDGSIRFGDAELGRLVEHMRETERWDRTVFTFLSDHGEAFWDRPLLEKRLGLQSYLQPDIYGVGHGHTLFPEQVGVPLVLHGPGVPVGRVTAQVRLIDVAPTLVSLAGVSHPEFEPRGSDLVSEWRAGELADRLALSETRTRWGRQRSIQDPEFQFVRLGSERELLFDRRDGAFAEVDPASPEMLDRFRETLDAEKPEGTWNADGSVPTDAEAPLDPQVCRELARLGYIELESCPASDP